jgi:type IX secretion system PorP/SprF family membrane protein
MKKTIIISFIVLGTMNLFGQQESAFSQYMFNSLIINPGYAGSHDFFSTNIIGRNQWLSYPGQPKTLTFSVDSRLPGENMGLGLSTSTDIIGVSQTSEIGITYSYFIQTGDYSRLAFGLKAGVLNYNDQLTELVVWDDDPEFNSNQSLWFPKFGFGLYYYSAKYYLGFSVPTLYVYDNSYDFDIDINKSSFYRRHMYLSGGYVFDLNENFKLKPFVLAKYAPSAPIQVDLNLAAVTRISFG